MPRSGSGLPFQEITAKLSAEELVKRLKVRLGHQSKLIEMDKLQECGVLNEAPPVFLSLHVQSVQQVILLFCTYALTTGNDGISVLWMLSGESPKDRVWSFHFVPCYVALSPRSPLLL